MKGHERSLGAISRQGDGQDAVSYICPEAFSNVWSGDLRKRQKEDEAASPFWDLDILGHLDSSLTCEALSLLSPQMLIPCHSFSLRI